MLCKVAVYADPGMLEHTGESATLHILVMHSQIILLTYCCNK